MPSQASNYHLPFFKIIGQTFILIKQRYKLFIKFSSPFILIQILSYFANQFHILETRSTFLIFTIINYIIFSIVVVAFNRIFIGDLKDIKQMEVFRLDSREWLFMAWLLLIIIAGKVLLSILVIPFVGILIHGGGESFNIVLAITAPPASYLISRLILTLPAASVDNMNANLTFAWILSKGNGFKLTLLITALPTIMYFLYDNSTINKGLISYISTLLVAFLAIGTLSLSYVHLNNQSNNLRNNK